MTNTVNYPQKLPAVFGGCPGSSVNAKITCLTIMQNVELRQQRNMSNANSNDEGKSLYLPSLSRDSNLVPKQFKLYVKLELLCSSHFRSLQPFS